MTSPEEMEAIVEQYCKRRSLFVESCLGVGTQGSVFVVAGKNRLIRHAVKVHDRKEAYFRERDIYLRLLEEKVTLVCNHEVPSLIHVDDTMLAIEMTIASPPFCLDFGGAYLDRRPDYSSEVWEEWHKQKLEAFETNWPAALKIIRSFEQYGIYIADVNPGNIRF